VWSSAAALKLTTAPLVFRGCHALREGIPCFLACADSYAQASRIRLRPDFAKSAACLQDGSIEVLLLPFLIPFMIEVTRSKLFSYGGLRNAVG
jgi:hypothetical protein